jgi:NAD-dependent SIR2 family protein deacetylase
VDGQFQKAGFAPARVVECHGSIQHLQCSRGCCREIWEANAEEVQIDEGSFRALNPLPKCRHCSAVARPNILMFGDWSWSTQRTDRQQGLFEEWMDGLRRCSAKLAIVEVGAGTAVATVRYTSERVTNRLGGRLIRINPRESTVPDGHIGLPMSAMDGIGRLCAVMGTVGSDGSSR